MNNDRYPTIGGWGKKIEPGGLCIICQEKGADCVVDLMLGWSKEADEAILEKYDIHAHCYLTTPPVDTLRAMITRHDTQLAHPILTREQFVKEKGRMCPVCHSKDIRSDGKEGYVADGMYHVHPCLCNTCGLHFTIDFAMSGFTLRGYNR